MSAACLLAMGALVFVYVQNDAEQNQATKDAAEIQEQIDEITKENPKADPSKLPVSESDEVGAEGDSVAENDLIIPETEDAFPIDTNHFAITKTGESTYSVELYAIINRPEQYQEYRDQLKQYKNEVIAYMNEQNVDMDTAEITYSPEEANSL